MTTKRIVSGLSFYKGFVYALLFVLHAGVADVYAQSGLCNANVPFFTADLSASPDAVWVSPPVQRNDNCCGTSFPDRCVEFDIILHPDAIGINFVIATGAEPPGALYYQINCGPQIPVGTPICLPGNGPHILTFCKPGANQNTYAISSIPKPNISPPQIATENCPATIWATDFVSGTFQWQDITYNGQYNNYLSCDDCDTVVVTPSQGFPPYVDFEICGTPVSITCEGIIIHCDTVRVYFYDTVVPAITPEPPMFCDNQPGVWVNGSHTGGAPPVTYQWFDQYNAGGNLLSNNTDYFAANPGAYSLVLYDSMYPNCPEAIYNFDVIENPTYVFTDDEEICQGEVFNWRGNDYSLTGTYYDSLFTIYGCDSVFVLNLTVNPIYEFIFDVEICDGNIYQWQGNSYTTTGTYYDSLLTAQGCDSILVLNLTVHPVYEFTENVEICDGEVFFWRGNPFTTTGTYYDNFLTSEGCDSIYILNLIVHPVYVFTDNDAICDGEVYTWRGNNYTTAGTYYDSLQTVQGCDSIFVLNLTVHSVFEFTENIGICDGEVYTWRGNIYTTAGTYYDSLQSVQGCDSVFILNLTVHAVYEYTENVTICDGDVYQWQGGGYTTAGTYYNNLLSVHGCDSVYILHLAVDPSYEYIHYDEMCQGGVYNWRGQDYTATGTYYDVLPTVDGCDSTFVLELTVNPIYEIVENGQACSGDDYFWRGDYYSIAGTYYDSLLTTNGCDSIFILNLVINPIYEFIYDEEICYGEVFHWRGNDYNIGGTYVEFSNSVSNCDSIYILYLAVNPVYAITENVVICVTDYYTWQGQDYAVSGTYYDSLQTVHGCDSVHILNLEIMQAYEIVTDEAICDGEFFTWRGNDYTVAGSYYDSLLTYQNCDSVFVLNLTVHAVYEFTENAAICYGDIFVWRNNQYTTAGTYYDSLQTIHGCDSVYVLNLTVHPVYEFTEDDEICNGETYPWRGNDYTSSGTYYDSLQTIQGCDSVYILNLTVHPVFEFTENAAICDGDTYSWRGNNYTAAGIYYDSLHTIQGCDSVFVLNLTVHPVFETTEDAEICTGDIFIWHGQQLITAGTYYDSLQTIQGCDSVFVLNLTVHPVYEFTEDDEICNGEAYPWRGIDYTSAGTYYDSLQTIQGCDSVYILNLTVHPVFEFMENAAICDGEIYPWRGNDYTTAGIYYDSLQTIHGCDSVFVLNLTVHPVFESTQNGEICDGDIFVWRDNQYTTTGTYYDSLQTTQGCDSVFVLNLTVHPVYVFTEDAEICTGEIFVWRNNQYSTAGTYHDSLQTIQGCDSVFVLNLTVNPVFETEESITICDGDVLQWQGGNYTSAGTYYDTLYTVSGCDSVFILHLSVNPSFAYTEYGEICQGEIYPWRGQDYTLSGTYYDSLQTINGCDSLFILELTVNPTHEIIQQGQVCTGDIFNWRGNDYDVTGTYFDSLYSIHGCDSVYVLELEVNPVYQFIFNEEICDGDVYHWRGNDYTVTGVYVDSSFSVYHCDSAYILNLIVNPVYEIIQDVEICVTDYYTWQGQNYNTGGTYYDSLQTVSGCDSVLILNLILLQAFEIETDEFICDGDVFAWRGNNYTSAGTYYDSLLTYQGCDSVFVLNLTVHPVHEFTEDAEICDGDIFIWRGNPFTTAGVYYDSLQTVNGCDSIFILNLAINPVYEFIEDAGICDGEIYQWQGQMLTSAGTYYDSLQTIHGCDSIWVLNLIIYPVFEFQENAEICDGDIFIWHGQQISTAGTYYDSLTSFHGCDSVFVLNLSVLDSYEFTEAADICDGDVYSWRGYSYTSAGTYYDSLQTTQGCDSIFVLHLTVNPLYEIIEDIQICDGDFYSWEGNDYFTSGTYQVNLLSSQGCDSIRILNLLVNPVFELTYNDTICQGDVYNWRGQQYAVAGTFYDTVQPPSGCDSIFTLNLTVLPNPIPAISATASVICNGSPVVLEAQGANTYEWSTGDSGHTITVFPMSTTTYTVTATDNNGCSGTAEISIQVYQSSMVDAGPGGEICEGESFQLNASGAMFYDWSPTGSLSNPNIPNPVATPAVTTTYYLTGTSPGGNLIFNGDFNSGNTGFTSQYVYSSDLWPEGNYYVTTNPNDHHSLFSPCGDHTSGTGNMMVVNGAPIPNQLVWCQTVQITPHYDYMFSTWLASVHPQNPAVLQFSINGVLLGTPFSATSTTCQWQEFSEIWNSGTNTTAEICIVNQNTIHNGNDFAIDDIFFAPLCPIIDSVVVVVNAEFEDVLHEEICNGDTYSWRGQDYTQSGTYYDSLQTVSGCDSVYVLHLTVNPVYEFIEDVIMCDLYLHEWQGNYYWLTGTYYENYTTISGCDSIYILNLLVTTSYELVDYGEICEGDTFTWRGQDYYTQDVYFDSLLSAGLCDSVYALVLTVHSNYEIIQDIDICIGMSYNWQGNDYTVTGTYYDSLYSIHGCDSVLILNLTIHPVYEFTEDTEICDGDIYSWQGNNYTVAGTYYDSLLTLDGCDSVYILHLTVHPVYEVTENADICDGETYPWRDNDYTTTGTYYDSLQTTQGCDSIFVLNLNVHSVYEFMDDADICDGDTYPWRGNDYIITGTYYDSLQTSQGCDSVYILNLIVHTSYEFTVDAEICEGETYFWRGNVYTTTDTYYDSLQTVTACDSIFILNLIVNNVPIIQLSGLSSICEGDTAIISASGGFSYEWSTGHISSDIMVTPLVSTTYTVTVTNSFGCTSSADFPLTVNPTPHAFAGSDQIICLGQSANFTAYGGGTYLWSNGSTLQSINVTPQTTTTYTVTITDTNGCTASDDAVVTVNPLPNIQAGPNTSICIGDSVQLTAGGGVYYDWEPITSISNPSIPNPIAFPTVSTEYYVYVADSNGCANTDTISIIVNPLPIAYAGGNQSICEGDTATFIATGGVSYLWNNGHNDSILIVSPTVTTTYSVVATDVNGCTASDEAILTVLPLPVANAGSDTANCFGTPTQLYGSGGVSYEWAPAIHLNAASAQNPIATPPATTTYTLTVYDINACSATDDVVLTILPLPQVILTGNQNLCYGDSTTLHASGGVTYIWSTGDSTPSIMAAPASTHQFNVTVTDAYGCSNNDSIIVFVHPTPIALAGNDTLICPNTHAQLNATGGGSYLWSPTTGLSAANIPNPTASPQTVTTYTVTVTDTNGCTDTDTVIIGLHPIPDVFFLPTSFLGCPPLTVNFSDSSSNNIAYWEWNFGDFNAAGNTSNLQNPSYTYHTPGHYTVSLTVTSLDGCHNSALINNAITVHPNPVAAFTATPTKTDLDAPHISFQDNSIGAIAWHWDFGDDYATINTSSLQNPWHTYSEEGLYKVLLSITSQHGCLDTTSGIIEIEPKFSFFIPNAFTPNGDGTNDFFGGFGSGFTDYHLMIFCRWGELIYESFDYGKPWNGKYWNEKEINVLDVFVYKIVVKDFQGKSHKYIGHVTLLK